MIETQHPLSVFSRRRVQMLHFNYIMRHLLTIIVLFFVIGLVISAGNVI
jgi:hypothetical protein